MHDTIDAMIDHTMTDVYGGEGSEILTFVSKDGTQFQFYHRQDCCESVSVEDIIGDLSDLVGSPIILAEECSSDDAPDIDDMNHHTWTFYRFGTAKGTVTVRWLGTSNGYYSESVDFEIVRPQQ